jgi:hypothetical protein
MECYGSRTVNSIEQLIADWIQVRSTLKRQLKLFEDGHTIVMPDRDSQEVTAEASERVHRVVTEIELLIAHYSSKG